MSAVPTRDITRRTVNRAVAELYAVPGRGLLALDALQRRKQVLRESSSMVSPPRVPTGLLVTIAHWRSGPGSIGSLDAAPPTAESKRVRHLLECVTSVLDTDVGRVIVAITSNEPEAVTADLAANADELPAGNALTLVHGGGISDSLGADRGVLVVGWRPSGLTNRHPYHLTWAHKALICSALRDPGLSHFLYIEDDLRFTQESLSYWCRYREPLARFGLLPGYVRVERLDGELYVVDQLERVSCSELPHVSLVDGEGEDATLRFVNLRNPYQGMYVLDRPLAIDHCRRSAARDPWRSSALVHWGVRERAAVGPTLDDVPNGFLSRNVVPVLTHNDGACVLQTDCAIEHLTGNYTRADNPYFGNIRVAELFTPAGLPT